MEIGYDMQRTMIKKSLLMFNVCVVFLLVVGVAFFYPRIRYVFFPKFAIKQIQQSISARDYWMTRDLTTYGYSVFTSLPSTRYSSSLLSVEDMIESAATATMAGTMTRLYDNKEALQANGYYFENQTASGSVWLSVMTWR